MASLLIEPEGDEEVKRQEEPDVDGESKQDGKRKTIRVGARRPKRRKPLDPGRPEQPKKKKRWPKLAPWSEDKKIVCLQENPKAKDKPSGVRYEKYKAAKTVREYLDLGGTKDDLRWDRRRSYVVAQGDGEALAALTADLQGMFDVVVPEVEAARKRYARQSEAFHAEREAGDMTDDPGRMISIAPRKATAIAIMRRRPIVSPNTNTAPSVTITGPSWINAVASASGK